MTPISELIMVLTLVFAVSSVIILVLDRFSHPTLPAYILAGLVLSNYLPKEEFLNLSQLGIAFLVFIFGLKTDLGRIKNFVEESLSATLIQVTLASVSMFVISKGLGFDNINAVYLAAAAALSSSLIGLELIESEIRIDLLHGRLAEAIQLMQDSLAILLIAVISSDLSYNGIASNIAVFGMMFAAALFIRQFLFEKFAELTEGSEELLMLAALTLLTGFISVGEYFNISIVVGSFAAGLAVARFPHNLALLDSMGSLKDFFSAIFFVSLGALIVYPTPQVLIVSGILILGTVIVTPLITGISLMVSGYDRRTSYLAGFGLDQISEFALIIAIQAYVAGSIAPVAFQSIILAATTTMLLSSYTSRYEEEIYSYIADHGFIEVNSQKINERTSIPEDLSGHVILVGYDMQGKTIAEGLKKENQEFIVVENDPEKISAAQKHEESYIFGDAMDSRVWSDLNIDKAELIISTIPSWNVSRKLLSLDTDTPVILRSSELGEAKKLLELGALYVNVPDILSSEELVDHINGVLDNVNYREELRRRKLLEVRRYLQSED